HRLSFRRRRNLRKKLDKVYYVDFLEEGSKVQSGIGTKVKKDFASWRLARNYSYSCKKNNLTKAQRKGDKMKKQKAF
ncbi:MAG: hypothetical protein ABI850_15385, partial [Flavobacterium sp.]